MSDEGSNPGAEDGPVECRVDLDESDGRLSPDELGFDPEKLDRPLVVWDGTCGFCRRSVEHLRDRAGDRLDFIPYQHVHRYFDDIYEEDFERAVHLIEPDGTYSAGAEAVFRALDYAPDGGTGRWLYEAIPAFAVLSERGYRWVAEHRPLVSKLSRWLVGEDLRQSRFGFARWIALRVLAIVFLIAFVSLGVQILGLIGSEGIVPAADVAESMRQANARGEGVSFWQAPSIFWWWEPTDGALTGLCLLGGALSVALFCGIWPRGTLAGIWAIYLSFASVSRPFLGYQWDTLLLETAFLAIFLAPAGWFRIRPRRDVSRLAVFLFHWLAFRLMFMSGAVKLVSGDPTWRDGTAMTYHFWTQPLPSWTAYWANAAPDVFLWLSTHLTIVIELGIPFLVFGPRRLRRLAGYAFLALQLLIFATGNYGFFNLLTAGVCLLLIDDMIWQRIAPGPLYAWVVERVEYGGKLAFRNWRRAGMSLLVAGVVGTTTIKMLHRFGSDLWYVPDAAKQAVSAIGSFRTLNNYGLFANMTTDRPEIIVQGSRDGETWREYGFRWKPGELDARPRFVEPHMPRLDWQMWFQALRIREWDPRRRSCGQSPWFVRFQKELLEGNKRVLDLMADNPFPDDPPRFVRTIVYDYEFAAPGNGEGRWWRRTNRRQLCPVFRLQDGQLRIERMP